MISNINTVSNQITKQTTVSIHLAGCVYQSLEEILRHALVHKETASRGAHLPGVEQETHQAPVHCGLEVSVRKDQHGALATELQRAGLHTSSSGRHDARASWNRSREGNLIDARVSYQWRARRRTQASDNIEKAWRQVRLPRLR